MAGGVARLHVSMSVVGSSGFIGPFDIGMHVAITRWSGPFSFPLADGVNAQAVAAIDTQGLTTVRGYVVTSDRNITVSYNGAAPEVLGAGGFHAKVGCAITAMTLTNASGDTAQVTYWMAGD